MKGEVVTYIPAELASAAQDRVVSSAEGIYDYRLKDNQENINKQVQEQIDNIETIPGEDGITPHIDPITYHWMIGDIDTGVVARGIDGIDGKTPYINPNNKHWMIDGIDTGIVAEGEKGDPFTYEDFTEEQLENLRGPQGFSGDIIYPTFKIDKQMHLIMYEGSDRIQREGSHLIINFENE